MDPKQNEAKKTPSLADTFRDLFGGMTDDEVEALEGAEGTSGSHRQPTPTPIPPRTKTWDEAMGADN